MRNQVKWNRFCLFIVFFLVGCGGPQQGKRFVDQVGDTNLLSLVNQLRNGNLADRNGTVPKNLWPGAVERAGVIRIQQYFSGVQFVLRENDRTETGVYVTTNLVDIPDNGSGIGFTQIKPGFFWFDQKIRDVSLAKRLLQNRTNHVITNISGSKEDTK
jgi:hypothetical protein